MRIMPGGEQWGSSLEQEGRRASDEPREAMEGGKEMDGLLNETITKVCPKQM